MRKYSAGISCEVYTPFLKCALRTVKVLRVVKDYRILEKSVRDEMTKEGINCSVDVRELMREIERERGQTYTPARTVFRDTGAVYTTTQRLPGKVASKPGVFNRCKYLFRFCVSLRSSHTTYYFRLNLLLPTVAESVSKVRSCRLAKPSSTSSSILFSSSMKRTNERTLFQAVKN